MLQKQQETLVRYFVEICRSCISSTPSLEASPLYVESWKEPWEKCAISVIRKMRTRHKSKTEVLVVTTKPRAPVFHLPWLNEQRLVPSDIKYLGVMLDTKLANERADGFNRGGSALGSFSGGTVTAHFAAGDFKWRMLTTCAELR